MTWPVTKSRFSTRVVERVMFLEFSFFRMLQELESIFGRKSRIGQYRRARCMVGGELSSASLQRIPRLSDLVRYVSLAQLSE